MQNLEERVNKIEERNKTVETDKAWETSTFRRVLLVVLTYLAVVIYFNFVKIEKPWLNAIVPALAFVISTLSMPFFKKFWVKMKKK
jgi:sterol desaturase/sphingolipid hydroxylase (fatty acid hydroxylase superfamily)